MSTQLITLVLTGGRTGYTGPVGKYQFVNGEADVPMIGSALKYMAICFAAHPKGSKELVVAQEKDAHGNVVTPASSGGGPADTVPSDVHEDGTSDEAATLVDGAADTGEPASEHGAEGDGERDARIQEALTLLDSNDDEHWTQGGKPAVHTVSDILNEPVSRSDIDAAAPDFKREGA